MKLGNDSSASFDPLEGRVATWGAGELTVLGRSAEGQYTILQQKRLEDSGKGRKGMCLIAGDAVLLALEDGRILVHELSDLSLREEFRPSWYDAPRLAAHSSDGRWGAILLSSGQLWLYDGQQKKAVRPGVSGQGSLSAIAFEGPQTLLVADRETRVTRYELDPFSRKEVVAPPLALVDMAYHFGVQPINAVLRKPVELDRLTEWLLIEPASESEPGPDEDMAEPSRSRVDAMGTLKHSSIFVVIVLGLTCLYISRKDF